MKLTLIQLWLGNIPNYFWYHYETTKELKDVRFLVFTDTKLEIDASNYEIIQTSREEIEVKVSSMLGCRYKISNIKKINDLKSCLGELFEDHLSGSEFWGFYDIDTLFGDFQKWVFPYMEEYDVISFADEIYHNRICGPLTIIRNTPENLRMYRNKLEEFISTLNHDDIDAFEEHQLSQILSDNLRTKLIYNSSNCETHNGGKNTYEAYWSGGKVFVKGEEKLLYHFYRKNHTKFQKVGNTISAFYDKKYVDDFLWVVHFSEKYETLLPYLMNSIKKYSNRKCVLYSINYTPDFLFKVQAETDQFIFRRIDIDPGPLDNRGRDSRIMNSKPIILMDAIRSFPGKKLVHIDTDIYLTANADNISKYFDRIENYPLMNSHIHDVMYISGISPDEEWTSPLHVLLDAMGLDKDLIFPRRKCNVILFDERSYWFFEEQMSLYNKFKDSGIPGILAIFDEDTANALLCKYQLTNSLPLVDIEENYDLSVDKIYNYSYNMTGTSPWGEFPRHINDLLFFHGFKNIEDYQKIQQEYGSSTLENEEFILWYSDNSVYFEKNSFLGTKKIKSTVDFVIFDILGSEVLRLNNQEIYTYWTFYINNIILEPKKYLVKIFESEGGKCVFNDILEVKHK